MSRWWRAHASALDDPKVQRLPGETFKAWFNVLCLACLHDGMLPPLSDIAFKLRKSEEATTKLLDALKEAGLIDIGAEGCMPHNWNKRQYKSDVSTERVQRFREQRRNDEETFPKRPQRSESESDTETDTEKKEQDHSVANAPQMSSKRGTRLTDDWALTTDLRTFAIDLDLDPDAERDAFVDYWTSIPGSRGLKLDWGKTFKNRCRELGKKRGGKAAPIETFDQRRIREGMAAIMGATNDRR